MYLPITTKNEGLWGWQLGSYGCYSLFEVASNVEIGKNHAFP